MPPGPLVIGCFVLVTFGLITAGPPLLGFIAEHFGIRLSYAIIVPVLLAALTATTALSAQRSERA